MVRDISEVNGSEVKRGGEVVAGKSWKLAWEYQQRCVKTRRPLPPKRALKRSHRRFSLVFCMKFIKE